MNHKGVSGVWIFALVIVLLTGTAFALTSGFGLMDFMDRFGTPILPETSEQITDLSDLEYVQTPLVRYHMQEALSDGNRLMLTLVAEPVAPEKHLLMGVMDLPTDYPEGSDRTYAQIAKDEGKTLASVNAPGIRVNEGAGGDGAADFVLRDGKLFYYMAASGLSLPSGDLSVTCSFFDREIYGVTETRHADGSASYELDAGEENRSEAVFTVTPAAASETLRFEGPFACERMTVNWVELQRTAASTY